MRSRVPRLTEVIILLYSSSVSHLIVYSIPDTIEFVLIGMQTHERTFRKEQVECHGSLNPPTEDPLKEI